MATIRFQSYAVTEINSYKSSVTGEDVKLITINLGLGSTPPVPAEVIEANKVSDIEKAFEAYAQKAKATGKPIKVSALVLKGRKPNGYDKVRFEKDLNV